MNHQQSQTQQWNSMPPQMGNPNFQASIEQSQYFNGASYLSQIPPTALQPQHQIPQSGYWGHGQPHGQSHGGHGQAYQGWSTDAQVPYQNYQNFQFQGYQHPTQNQNLAYNSSNYAPPQAQNQNMAYNSPNHASHNTQNQNMAYNLPNYVLPQVPTQNSAYNPQASNNFAYTSPNHSLPQASGQSVAYNPPNNTRLQVPGTRPNSQLRGSPVPPPPPPPPFLQPQEVKPKQQNKRTESYKDTVEGPSLTSLRCELAKLRQQLHSIMTGASKKSKREGSPHNTTGTSDLRTSNEVDDTTAELHKRKRQRLGKQARLIAKETSATQSLDDQDLVRTSQFPEVLVTNLVSLDIEEGEIPGPYYVSVVQIALSTQAALRKHDKEGKDLVQKIYAKVGVRILLMCDIATLSFAVATLVGTRETVTIGLSWLARCDDVFPLALTSFETDLKIASISKLLIEDHVMEDVSISNEGMMKDAVVVVKDEVVVKNEPVDS